MFCRYTIAEQGKVKRGCTVFSGQTWNSKGVEPERHPRDNYKHASRHVDCDEVVGELSLENEVHR